MHDSNNANEMLEVTGQVLIRCFVMGVLVLLFWLGALALGGGSCIQCSRQDCSNIPRTVLLHPLCWRAHDQGDDILSVPFSIHSN